MIYEEIGAKIKKLREDRGLTKQMLAEELGYESDTAIHLIEAGKRKVSLEKLKLIANYFKVTISEFISEDVQKEDLDIMTALRSDEQLDEKDVAQIYTFIDFIKQKGK